MSEEREVDSGMVERTLCIDSDTATRRGVHADTVMFMARGGCTLIDFILTDRPGENGSSEDRAVLTARVFMNNEDVVRLRDRLIAVTSSWSVGPDGEAK